jgi:hypothetical protein
VYLPDHKGGVRTDRVTSVRNNGPTWRELLEGGDVLLDDGAGGHHGPQLSSGARAVLVTLREAVTPGPFDDVASQLPQEYSELTGPSTQQQLPGLDQQRLDFSRCCGQSSTKRGQR